MHSSIKIHIITISEIIKWNICRVIWMIDCSFYAVCGLNMLLSRVCDGCHYEGYDASGLFDPSVMFVNVCVQGHDAPSERETSISMRTIAFLLQSGCVSEMVKNKFQTTHLNTPTFFNRFTPYCSNFSPLSNLWSIWRAEHFLTWSFSFP